MQKKYCCLKRSIYIHAHTAQSTFARGIYSNLIDVYGYLIFKPRSINLLLFKYSYTFMARLLSVQLLSSHLQNSHTQPHTIRYDNMVNSALLCWVGFEISGYRKNWRLRFESLTHITFRHRQRFTEDYRNTLLWCFARFEV